MKLLVKFFLLSVAILGATAEATILRLDFSGVFTSTYDDTGTGFGNGVGANTGQGTTFEGTMLWNLDNVRGRQSPNSNLYDTYLIDNVPRTPAVPLSGNAPDWTIKVNGNEYRGNKNLGVIDTVLYADQQLGASEDWLHLNAVSEGHDAISPVVDGHYDALASFFSFNFWIHDANGGTINGLDFAQPINWTAGAGSYATGNFDVSSQIYRDSIDYRHSGIPSDLLLRSGGQFSLTSLVSSTSVPEPATTVLLGLGMLGMIAIRRRANSSTRQQTP